MSSVTRSLATLSNKTYWCYNGVYYGTLDFMKTYFNSNNATYFDSFVLFPSETDLAQAIVDIETACDTAGEAAHPGGFTEELTETWRDLGHEIKLGVIGGKSDYFTYRKMKYLTNKLTLGNNATGGVYYVLVEAEPTPTMSTTLTVGGTTHGRVYVARGY